MLRKVFAAAILGCGGFAFSQMTTTTIGSNIAPNGDFERGSENWVFAATSDAGGRITTDTAHSGFYSYRLTNRSPQAPHVYCRLYRVLNGLEPFTTYRIGCHVKGQNAGICWIGGGPGWGHRQRFPGGTFDWQFVETEFSTDGSGSDYDLMVCSESRTEALFVDDITVHAVRADVARRDEAVARFDRTLATQTGHFKKVESLVAKQPGAIDDPVIRLGLAVARRFLDRVIPGSVKQSRPWSTMQLEEVDEVLSDTQTELGRLAYRRDRAQPFPLGAPVVLREGLLFTDTTAAKPQPFYFYGMGHFGQVFKDLPNWRDLGVTVLQDGRCGPSSMNPDGTLAEGAKTLIADLKRASLYNLKTDFLLSPHYFPDWAYNGPAHDELTKPPLGFINFNIDHPVARDAVGRWADKISSSIARHPALLSVCLSNEPVYDDSGRTPQTLALYQKYLEAVHQDIGALNELYETSYSGFSEIKAPGRAMTGDEKKNRAFYDWREFNNRHFADWHAWLRDIVKKHLPQIPVHAKIMVFQTMDRGALHHGIDPELICRVTDLAGCDAYAFPAPDYKTFDWHGHAFWYDLLHSFRGQPVFNSENHIIPDGTGALHIPMTMTRAQYWQGALHHQGASTTWVWEEAGDPSLSGSIYFRPANIYGAGRAFLDINRFAAEVTAINQAPPRIALLYSQPSIVWSDKYAGAIQSTYRQLNFLGEKVTFVSERQLADGSAPKVACIVVPGVTNATSATVTALESFAARDGRLMMVGPGNLARDEYNRPRELPDALKSARVLAPGKNEFELALALRDMLTTSGLELVDLKDASGKHTWGVEYRMVNYAARKLMPLINYNAEPLGVMLPNGLSDGIDLLNGSKVSGELRLEPMVPHLLQFKGQEE